ncbi:MinD/ParA family ATP-binding protein [Burkholderia ubonensis]|uniref:Flagellar biosynthesis protein FlhG n=1 Tax=Burkholderia ubonensis TaxID=101571 RepID=A0A124LGD4_9BURK|nr:flagellar biosynthesis protein FlhG [Burkholderia ubonensis]AOI69123.1 flagellar biosynthesis protein FlhG [Burkholderia ubonensis]KUZ19543.1 flagellar biosynthesis protein FlhG [Burkholderia ubonensis]KUZ30337.1 flagellar biosynthesis protein FlhG [Burkholderia ubonensis]KUZ38455.1 flagellar biosynthesis protein FlhG [Burkholderia ubonensis]KUZ42934.1 flagellar biosynthesis protein FlhG [Burkholderia ubonensis]
MDKRMIDQAEGLRRLLAGRASRIVAVAGGPAGVGCTSTVVNLAAALAALGKDVLVVDERADVHSAAATLAGSWLRDGARTRVAAGFSVCAASRLARAGYSDAQLSDFVDGPADIVLVDAQLDADGGFSALAREAHDVLIVTRVAAQAITEAYACMKRLHFAHAIAQFRVLTNHVGSHADAKTAFDNLAGVASRYLTVSIADAGCVSADPLVEHARELVRTAVDAFPSSPAARDYRQIAADLLYWPLRPRPGAGAARAGGSTSFEAGAAHAA